MDTIASQSVLAFAAGMMLNFMPCVLPVMPFKIHTLLRETGATAQSRTLAAVALLGGSLLFFIVLGAVTAGLGMMWGQQFQHPWFRILLSLILFAAAFATFTERSWRLPKFVYRVPMSRYLGAFLTGCLAAVLSTPCSGPFLGSVLAFAATRSALETLVIFSAIGIGLAFPYVVLLLWPGLLDRLSFSSRLAVNIKTGIGFVLLAGGLFFIQGFLPSNFIWIAWTALALSICVWLVLQLTGEGWVKMRPVLLLVLAVTAVSGFQNFSIQSRGVGIDWQMYSDQRLREATGRPVLVEFTADWCINCKTLERTTFRDRQLLEVIDKFGITALRVDLTQVDDARRQLFDRFGGRAIPYILILDKKGQLVQRFTGMVAADTLIDSIKAIES